MNNGLNELGSKIRNLRQDNDLTQKELSSKLGLTPKMVSFYENNQRTPPIDILLRISNIFGVSIDYLVGNTMNKQETNTFAHIASWNNILTEYPNAIRTTPEIRDLIDYYEQLSLQDKRWIMGQMIDLIKKSEEQKSTIPKVQ